MVDTLPLALYFKVKDLICIQKMKTTSNAQQGVSSSQTVSARFMVVQFYSCF